MTKDNNHAILFTNNKTNSNQPDYKGSFELNGKKGQAAAWIKTAKNNQKYLSISFQDSSEKPVDNKINKERKKIANQVIKDDAVKENEEEAQRIAIEKKNLDYAIKQAKDSGKSTVKLGEGKKTKTDDPLFPKRFLKKQW